MQALPQVRSALPNTKPVPYKGFADDIMKGFASIVPPEADVSAVAEAIVKVVDTPFGKRPFRVHVGPTQDGAEAVNAVLDRVRGEMLRRMGLADVLTPRALTSKSQGEYDNEDRCAHESNRQDRHRSIAER